MNVQYSVYTQPVSVDFAYVKVWQKYDYMVTFEGLVGGRDTYRTLYHFIIKMLQNDRMHSKSWWKNRLLYKKIIFIEMLQPVRTTRFDFK